MIYIIQNDHLIPGVRNEQELQMHQLAKHDDVTTPADRPGLLAPDTSGMNFYRADPALTDLLRIHLPDPLFRHIEPHLDRLRALAGGPLHARRPAGRPACAAVASARPLRP